MRTSLADIEATTLSAIRNGRSQVTDPTDHLDWVALGLYLALDSCRTIRDRWIAVVEGAIERKPDGTAGIPLERDIETTIRRRIAEFSPDAHVVGEESGGTLPDEGWAVAIDPIDGTWAFFNGTESVCVSLGLFEHGRCVAGVVANPATGEVAYGGDFVQSRLLRVALFGESDRAADLPIVPPERQGVALVSVHPDSGSRSLFDRLRKAWSDGEIRSMRAPGGSPAWGVIDAAKGRYTYVNAWTSRAAEPFDLAGAVKVLRAAGGDAVDLDGEPINATSHAGPFIAGVDSPALELVTGLIRDAARR